MSRSGTAVASSPPQATSILYVLFPSDLKNRESWMNVLNGTLLMRTTSETRRLDIGNKTRNCLKGLFQRSHNTHQNRRLHSHRLVFFEETILLDPKFPPPYDNFNKHFMTQQGFED
jgi:hypothetical protein